MGGKKKLGFSKTVAVDYDIQPEVIVKPIECPTDVCFDLDVKFAVKAKRCEIIPLKDKCEEKSTDKCKYKLLVELECLPKVICSTSQTLSAEYEIKADIKSKTHAKCNEKETECEEIQPCCGKN